jgi:hypothetical protein
LQLLFGDVFEWTDFWQENLKDVQVLSGEAVGNFLPLALQRFLAIGKRVCAPSEFALSRRHQYRARH